MENTIDLTSTSAENQIKTIVTETVVNENMSTESANKGDSGIQRESLSISDSNVNESVLINEGGATSTPITIKTNIKEKEMSMNDLFNLLSKRFDSNDAKFDEQKNEIKSSFNEKFDEQNVKFNELKGDINNIDINNVKNKCVSQCNELIVVLMQVILI